MTPDEKSQLDKLRATAMTRQGEVEESEDEMYAEASPKGRFTAKGTTALVEATNRLLPLFGIGEKYEKIGEVTTLPPDFMRLLTMFAKAIEDAVTEGILPEDAIVDLKVATDDNGLQSIAGRIGMVAKSPGFKKFLMRKVTTRGAPAGEETEEEESPEVESETDTEALFASRMS
jgi:hypothetical protein